MLIPTFTYDATPLTDKQAEAAARLAIGETPLAISEALQTPLETIRAWLTQTLFICTVHTAQNERVASGIREYRHLLSIPMLEGQREKVTALNKLESIEHLPGTPQLVMEAKFKAAIRNSGRAFLYVERGQLGIHVLTAIAEAITKGEAAIQ